MAQASLGQNEGVIGIGTLINVMTIVAGSAIGVFIGHKLPERTHRVVTDGLGLIVLVMGGMNLAALADSEYVGAVGAAATFLIVVGSIILGSIIGSLIGIERRLSQFGDAIHARVSRGNSHQSEGRDRFIRGFVDSSLIFAVGPMAILGAFADGMGLGPDQLILKSVLDGFGSIVFATALGWGVAFSAIPVGIWQGLLTVLAFTAGSVLPGSHIAAITATGGILLLGVAIRVMGVRSIAVADMLPALVVAPLLTSLVSGLVRA